MAIEGVGDGQIPSGKDNPGDRKLTFRKQYEKWPVINMDDDEIACCCRVAPTGIQLQDLALRLQQRGG
jgi:hypothetical protein